MRIAILSDIHANLEALEAVLDDALRYDVERHWVLGDIVGYNADPRAVLERLGNLDDAVVLGGNHDLCATGRFDVAWFNSVAAAAIMWTRAELSQEELDRLASLEPRGSADGALLVHGSVNDPAGEYVTNASIAERSFEAEPFDVCFFGHTHLPVSFHVFDDGVRGWTMSEGEPVRLDGRSMINPGSVGQPRDGDPRASYCVYDTVEQVAVNHRVAYPLDRTQEKIRAAGLPEVLAGRLEVGR